MAERERYEVSDYTGGRDLSSNERIRSEMAFLAENPEAFGLVPDACPLATKHLLIAANGHSNEGGGSSLVYDMDHPGVDGLQEFYGKILPRDVETSLALQFAFGESRALREHPVSRFVAALAEITALRVMNGPCGGAAYEHILVMLDEDLRRNLHALRDRFVELDQLEVIQDDVFSPNLCVCRIQEEGGGHYVVDVFAAGDFRVYIIDEQGMSPLWTAVTPPFAPDGEEGLSGRSIRLHHPAPFAVLLVSESICALNAAENRGVRRDPGMIWLYRMRLEEYFLRLMTDCVREYEFGDRATRFFVGHSHGRDSASGALTIMREGVTYETFRLHCQNRLSELGHQMTLLPEGYNPYNVVKQESRARTELSYLRELLDNSHELADRVANALRITILRKFERGEGAPSVPPPADVPEYGRLNLAEIQKAFRHLDRENDEDRARIRENNAVLTEHLSEHWITLRPVLMASASDPWTGEEDITATAWEHRRVSDEIHRVCLDMNRRLVEMRERRQETVRAVQSLLAQGLDVLSVEGEDWICGRAGVDSVRSWLEPLQSDLPALLDGMKRDWRADTESYRSLLTAYLAQRDDLFQRDTQEGLGGFAEDWQAILAGELPEERWEEWLDCLGDNPETAGFAEFMEALCRISQGTGALLGRIRYRATENRMARDLSNRLDLRLAALRGAAYEDPDWGDEIIAVMDTPTRNEFRATVRRWQETRQLMEHRKQAYESYSAMYATYEKVEK